MALVSRRRSHSSRLPAPASYPRQGVTGSSANVDGVVNVRPTVAPAAARLPRQHVKRGWLVRRMLLTADVVGLSAAFFATELLFLNSEHAGHRGIATLSAIFVLVLPAWILAAKFYGLYDQDEERATHSTADEVFSVFHLITVGVWLFFATSWLVGLSGPRQAKLTTFWLLAFVRKNHRRDMGEKLASVPSTRG